MMDDSELIDLIQTHLDVVAPKFPYEAMCVRELVKKLVAERRKLRYSGGRIG